MRKADKIIISKAIFNGVSQQLINGMVAICGNEIEYVGDCSKLEELRSEQTEVIDAGDKLVMPAFHDAHIHMYMSGIYASPLVHVNFTDHSATECVEGLKELAERVDKDKWLIGAGWYHTLWDEPVLPTKDILDEYYPDRPVCMVSADAHTLWVNTKGLEKLGITKESIPPRGGSYAKDENGELVGLIQESAAMSLVPKIYDFELEEAKGIYRNFMKILNSYGITSTCDVSMMSVPGADFVRDDIYEELLKDDVMTVRVNMFPTLIKDLSRAYDLRDKFDGQIVRCQGVKQFFDGVSSTHTAYLKDDYSNANFDGDHGYPTMKVEEMEELILWAHKNDFSARVHTIGDQAIHCLIDCIEKANQTYGKKPYLQHTLEHLENIQEPDIQRLADNDIIPSCQPAHLMIDPEGIEKDLGQERMQYMWAFRSMLDAGCNLAFGTDSPVVGVNPFEGIFNAVTRSSAFTQEPKDGWVPKEKISLFESLRAYTYGAACAASREDKIGILTQGKLADIIILDRNLFNRAPEELLETKVETTLMDGQIVYQA